jgi:hypothetical protein
MSAEPTGLPDPTLTASVVVRSAPRCRPAFPSGTHAACPKQLKHDKAPERHHAEKQVCLKMV